MIRVNNAVLDMQNEFKRVMDSLLKHIPFTNCYIDDILIASKASLEEHKAIPCKTLNILESKNVGVKWEKRTFFQKDTEWLGFKISHTGVKPLVVKLIGLITKSSEPEEHFRIRVILWFNKPLHKILP